ncbi:hypothetical protein ES703_91205 [subsurface metagenome]
MLAKRSAVPERIWWSNFTVVPFGGPAVIIYSNIIPSGSIITEVKIQARSETLGNACLAAVMFRLVSGTNLTYAEVAAAETIIPWKWVGGHCEWFALGEVIDESWQVKKKVIGSSRRLMVYLSPTGVKDDWVRTSVQYQLP